MKTLIQSYVHCLCRKENKTFLPAYNIFSVSFERLRNSRSVEIIVLLLSCKWCILLWRRVPLDNIPLVIGKDRIKIRCRECFRVSRQKGRQMSSIKADQSRSGRHFFAIFKPKRKIIQTRKGAKNTLFVCLPIDKQCCFRFRRSSRHRVNIKAKHEVNSNKSQFQRSKASLECTQHN